MEVVGCDFGCAHVQRLDYLSLQVDYAIAILHFAFYLHKALSACGNPVFLQDIRHDYDVGEPGFIQQGHKHKPLAVPGRWRVSTCPAAMAKAPSGTLTRSMARLIPRLAHSFRRCAIGW